MIPNLPSTSIDQYRCREQLLQVTQQKTRVLINIGHFFKFFYRQQDFLDFRLGSFFFFDLRKRILEFSSKTAELLIETLSVR